MPGRAAEPASAAKHATQAAKPHVVASASAKPVAGAAMKAVVCSGPFSKDSSNLKLAITFDPKNITYSDITVSGSPVGSSVLYGKDPKRRLEIWWQNQANRGGMKLGLTLAELEKLNHKPFKLKGFDKDSNATISDWDGGALATLPGGCKFGISLQPDPKASPDAISALSADKEFTSDDSAMRDVKPKVSEILIGY
jgi:hypothetical protein